MLLLAGHGGCATDLPDRIASAVMGQLPGATCAHAGPGLLAFSGMSLPATQCEYDPGDRLLLLGRAFLRENLRATGACPVDPAEISARAPGDLVRLLWGSYVAVRQTGDVVTVLRDAGGGVPVYIAEGDDFVLLASALPRWLLDAAGLCPRADIDALAGAIVVPVSATYRSLLKGVRILAAGQSVTWRGGRLEEPRSWWPCQAALVSGLDDSEAASRLRLTTEACCRTLAAPHRRVTVELSGGFDSSVVTALLARSGLADLSAVNFASEHSSGDERHHARCVAERWGARLVEVSARASDLDFATLFGSEASVEPLFYGLDPLVERASTGVARAFDSSAIFTGQGGDAVFYNLATPLVAADHMRAHGVRSLFSRTMLDTAHRTRRSVWAVQGAMLRDWLLPRKPAASAIPGVLAGRRALAAAQAVPDHPWLAAARDWPPGRIVQLQAIANCQMFYGPTERRARTELVHPLLAQPLVELCLGLPSYQLASGRSDRALARTAFDDLLPESVRRRRGKGDASNYYRRAIVENLDFLREHLLDGVLVANGMLDPDMVDGALQEDCLIWSDQSRLIAIYASLEAWARYWGVD